MTKFTNRKHPYNPYRRKLEANGHQAEEQHLEACQGAQETGKEGSPKVGSPGHQDQNIQIQGVPHPQPLPIQKEDDPAPPEQQADRREEENAQDTSRQAKRVQQLRGRKRRLRGQNCPIPQERQGASRQEYAPPALTPKRQPNTPEPTT